MILQSEIRSALIQLGLAGKSVCVHSSIRSFGDRLENGLCGLLNSFLDCGCTIMAPTFSKMFMQQPDGLYQPAQNGTAYGAEIFADPFEYDPSLIYSPDTSLIATNFMGAFPTFMVDHGRIKYKKLTLVEKSTSVFVYFAFKFITTSSGATSVRTGTPQKP